MILMTFWFLVGTALSAYTPEGPNIVGYYGQGPGQLPLSKYCKNIDIAVLSFLNNFSLSGGISANFGNACDTTSDSCPALAQEILECQAQGVKVMVSIGGENGDYGLAAEYDGYYMAQKFYKMFGPMGTMFPNVYIDGVDLDLEHGRHNGYQFFVEGVKQFFGEDFLVSAAPQCVFPDKNLHGLMKTTAIDMAFIQFYNNPCSLDKEFNWNIWQEEAKTFKNPEMKLYVGVPGSEDCAGSGYVNLNQTQLALKNLANSSSFGGVSVWDVSRGEKFIEGLARLV